MSSPRNFRGRLRRHHRRFIHILDDLELAESGCVAAVPHTLIAMLSVDYRSRMTRRIVHLPIPRGVRALVDIHDNTRKPQS